LLSRIDLFEGGRYLANTKTYCQDGVEYCNNIACSICESSIIGFVVQDEPTAIPETQRIRTKKDKQHKTQAYSNANALIASLLYRS
jgi:hypothetical protein